MTKTSDLQFCGGCDRIAPNPAQGCGSIYCKWEKKYPLGDRDRLRAEWAQDTLKFKLKAAYQRLEKATEELNKARRIVEELEAEGCASGCLSESSPQP